MYTCTYSVTENTCTCTCSVTDNSDVHIVLLKIHVLPVSVGCVTDI